MNLAERYRPRCWDDVAGQDDAVRAIRAVLAQGWGGRAWWITGKSGHGKTTLAKLIASEGASEHTTREVRASGLTPAAVNKLECEYSSRSLFGAWCIIVNECHGLRSDTVTAMLDALERLPPCCVWIFTTTKQGQASFFADDEHGDAQPLVQRCTEIVLQDGPSTLKALARRAKAIATACGNDGLPDAIYDAAMADCKGSLRGVLQRVESGQLKSSARAAICRELADLRTTTPSRRVELQAQLAAIGG